ncbi:MAG TPA: ZIP family metal transporter [Sphingomicrobium sp.]|nr:ZIP family metal transporter [Sphingomicrobium sp.]
MKRTLLWALLPLLLIVAVATAFVASDPLGPFRGSAPPVEELTVERTVLDEHGIGVRLRAGGSEAMKIVQVQVDGAYWMFSQDPSVGIERMSTAWLQIPYHWVAGEAHHLAFITNTGALFEHTIDVAVATPTVTSDRLTFYALIGLFVGVVPIALGMMFYPALRAGGPSVFEFALALTIGLLAFLLVDTLSEGLEFAGEAAAQFHGPALVWLPAALTFAVLMAIGRRKGEPLSGVALATSIALGIGLHNLGEGLAIGAAFATGAAALGSFLVIGFTLHNVTEGIGIAAPMLAEKPRFKTFVALVALAGLPAVLGIWIGSFAFSAHWAALALGIGAGAILQVIVEVGAYLARKSREQGRSWASLTILAGVTLGIVVMYATAFLVQV